MKRQCIIFFLCIVLAAPCFAGDFIVDFIEENYNESPAQFSDTPVIYHSIQVNSRVGPKLLILTGEDGLYRRWLRQYIAQNKKFVAQISEDRMDEFISAKAFAIDVTSLHPFNGAKWQSLDVKSSDQSTLQGNNHILIVDPNEKRSRLIKIIVEKMPYQATIFKAGTEALDSFKLQPNQFNMVIVQYTDIGMPPDQFIEQVLKINHTIPIVIDTGYKNQPMENKFISRFSGFDSVHIQPVILRDLQKTIDTLAKKNA